jgi:carbamoyltransferase
MEPSSAFRGGRDVITLGIGGVNHDFSAALAINGAVVVAISEERLTREKYSVDVDRMRTDFESTEELARQVTSWNDYLTAKEPLRDSIEYVLDAAGVASSDLDAVAYCCQRALLPSALDGVPAIRLNHHRSHAASSYLASPFEDATVLVADGAGDRIPGTSQLEAVSVYAARGRDLELRWHLGDPHSIGGLYEAATHLAGYRLLEEGKTMALASFGGDRFYESVRSLVEFHDDGRFALGGEPVELRRLPERRSKVKMLREACDLPGGLGFADRADLAFAVQKVTEELFVHVVRAAAGRTGSENLCVAGGVALNSVANYVALRAGPCQEIFVQPHAGDGGLAVGNALLATEKLTPGRFRRWRMPHAYLGRTYSASRIRMAIEAFDDQVTSSGDADVVRRSAGLLAAGKIIGWFQGGSEWGPRALGNRSILADPRSAETKRRLDESVKKREPFRPYAPVVLADRAAEYFDLDRASPYMLLVAPVRPEKAAEIPAVVHVDGTARLQTVDRTTNVRLAALLEAFEAMTGVPVLLNTSFNMNREPIVETPEDAIRSFLSSEMDALVLGDQILTRREKDASHAGS